MAAQARERLIALRREFIAETVGSHPSKVDLVAHAKHAGYFVHIHVLMAPESLVIRRVRLRVDAGGHDVPETKIRARYRRLWANVAAIIGIADTVDVYDNSGEGPRIVARFVAGEQVGEVRWPPWTPVELVQLNRSVVSLP